MNYSKVAKTGYVNNYNKKTVSSKLQPAYNVYHLDSNYTQVTFAVNSDELLFIKGLNSTEFSSRIRIVAKQFDIKTNVQLDTSSYVFNIFNSMARESIVTESFKLNLKQGAYTLLELTMTDLNKNNEAKNYIDLDKTNFTNRQNFRAYQLTNKQELFTNYATDTNGVLIELNKPVSVLYGRYYKRDFPIALPPFSTNGTFAFKYQADSLFKLTANKEGKFVLPCPIAGIYHLQTDTLTKDGFTVFRYAKQFPDIRIPEQMISALRYILSKQEYEELTSAENKKKAIDNFFLGITGNTERARDVIKIYYNRVRDANTNFTSYTEGWRTDRGMIYIIYGAPQAIYKNDGGETWIYGEENNFRSISFAFSKMNNPFTNNDYSLNRNAMFKDHWYLAVDTWRQGRAFNN